MASQGYHDLIRSLGISTVIVSFSFSGSFFDFTLSPTKVMAVQAEIICVKLDLRVERRRHTNSTKKGGTDNDYKKPPHFFQG